MNPTVEKVTERIRSRSNGLRQVYLDGVRRAAETPPVRGAMACSNLAHGFAACGPGDKQRIQDTNTPNVAIVTAYNDMLSAHQPFADFPDRLKAAARAAGGVAQVAGGVPAMCDGVTQGRAGMELSLLSRDVIAMSTAVALSHDMFDAALCLGVCDKIVPGLVIGSLAFGHLPTVFVPAGPMPSGLSNAEKAKVRQRHAAGEVGRDELLAAESAAYHGAGTCTFFGTANSNQMFMEVMGLQLPGASFVNPGTPLRDALTAAAAAGAIRLTRAESRVGIGHMIDERSIVNAIVGLLATGGSTNHTIHLVAMARAAGIDINWDDFDALSAAVPLVARVYPNGDADVNEFHRAGGLAFLIGALLDAGLLHPDTQTVVGEGLVHYRAEAMLDGDTLIYRPGPATSRDLDVLRPASEPFQATGGLRLVTGNLGRAVVKTSAVAPDRVPVTAPATVFDNQAAVETAFRAGHLNRDTIVVLRGQGPRHNGMPELHALMPILGLLQDAGHRVALVTDGRLSGASGKVPAAIHVTPEASVGGPLARVEEGDTIRFDPEAGVLALEVDNAVLANRSDAEFAASAPSLGRALFGAARAVSTGAEQGAVTFGADWSSHA